MRDLSSRTSEASVGIHYPGGVTGPEHMKVDPDTRAFGAPAG
jgi:hypothetical protein